MLGKLIKNEFKTTWQSMMGIYLAAGITAVVMVLLIAFKLKVITTLGSITLVGISVVALIMTIIMVITNYYRSMFSIQGYLTFTLPVKSSQLLFSKTIVSFIWILLSFVLAGAILVFLFFYLVAQASDGIKGITKSFYDMLQQIKGIPDVSTVKFLLALLTVVGFISLLAFVCKVYFSMTIANTKMFGKMNTTLASIIVYVLIYIVSQIINVLCVKFVPLAFIINGNEVRIEFTRNMIEQVTNSSSAAAITIPIGGYIFSIIIAVVLYFITSNLIKTKVNLK